MFDKYLVFKNGFQYGIVFYNLRAACDFCLYEEADYVVDADTGEILGERCGG